MTDPEAAARWSAALVSRAGGYLRNPVHTDNVTCAVCTTPVDGYRRCLRCNGDRSRTGLADDVAFLTYAVAGQQSGYVMRGYKAPRPLEEHRTIMALLLLVALSRHAKCPGALAGRAVTHWATVPSLPAKPGEHPFHAIVSKIAPWPEIPLAAATSAPHPRAISPEHFYAHGRLRPGSHVLLLDDTWTTGGHAQSAVLGLRAAGAARVSLLVVARWIKADYGDNAAFLRSLADHDYDPEVCPWWITGTGPDAARH
jgi:hypothetical protein